jgi:hypothetical protein
MIFMRSPLFILVAAFLVSLLIAQYVGSFHAFQAPSKSTNGSDLLLTLLHRDQTLAPALAAADGGDGAPLLAWLNAADPLTRQTLVVVLEHIARSHDGLDRDDDSAAMDAAFYRYRQRFIAFVNIPTGDSDLDAELDNLLAYILVAGTSQPSASDVNVAKQILPRLEKQVEHTPTSAVWDTIGCVYYVSSEDAKAKAAFQQAVNCAERELAKSEAAKKPLLERTLSLARRRLQVAQESDLRAVEKRGSTIPRAPLPLNNQPTPAAEPVH